MENEWIMFQADLHQLLSSVAAKHRTAPHPHLRYKQLYGSVQWGTARARKDTSSPELGAAGRSERGQAQSEPRSSHGCED